jgi:hypothetical protein
MGGHYRQRFVGAVINSCIGRSEEVTEAVGKVVYIVRRGDSWACEKRVSVRRKVMNDVWIV